MFPLSILLLGIFLLLSVSGNLYLYLIEIPEHQLKITELSEDLELKNIAVQISSG